MSPYEMHLSECPECGAPLGKGQKWCDKHKDWAGIDLNTLGEDEPEQEPTHGDGLVEIPS